MKLTALLLILPGSFATISMKFFEMQSEHAEAHVLGVTPKVLRAFKEFELEHEKGYDREERKLRAKHFETNFNAIANHNAKEDKTWTMGLNEVCVEYWSIAYSTGYHYQMFFFRLTLFLC